MNTGTTTHSGTHTVGLGQPYIGGCPVPMGHSGTVPVICPSVPLDRSRERRTQSQPSTFPQPTVFQPSEITRLLQEDGSENVRCNTLISLDLWRHKTAINLTSTIPGTSHHPSQPVGTRQMVCRGEAERKVQFPKLPRLSAYPAYSPEPLLEIKRLRTRMPCNAPGNPAPTHRTYQTRTPYKPS